MKKSLPLLLVATIAIVFCFSSCTKEPEKIIVGKWKVVSADCGQSQSNDEFYDGFIDGFSDDKGETWTFEEDGTFKGYFNALPYFLYGENTGLINGNIKCDYICDDGTIKLRNGNLNGAFYDYESYKYSFSFTFDIDEITSKSLSLSGKLTTVLIYEDGDTETMIVNKLKYALEKK